MPRIRTIKPDFFTSETVSALQFRTRLTWIGLWTHCDDHGRHRDNVKLIKAAVWPLDAVSLRDVAEDLDALIAAGLLYRYEVDGRTYLQVTNWAEHQKVDRPSKSALPEPPDPRETLASPRDDASSPRDRKGKEGKGREGTRASAREAPPPRCPEHLQRPADGACGPCGDARKTLERWERDRATEAALVTQAAARERAEANRLAIAACNLCDERGYLGAQPCAHDPTLADRAKAGAAAVRNRLAGLAGGAPRCEHHPGQTVPCDLPHPEATT